MLLYALTITLSIGVEWPRDAEGKYKRIGRYVMVRHGMSWYVMVWPLNHSLLSLPTAPDAEVET